VKGRLTAGLMIGEGKRREAETRLSAFDRCSSPNGSLLKWSINRCLVVTTALRPEACEGNRSNWAMEKVSEIVIRSLGHERKSSWEQS
jgi:hypothetical protein